jgi:monoamine oxidase
VKLSTPVKIVTQKPTGECVVETSNSFEIYRAKRVIVSIPTTLYPSITFDPALPPAKKILAESTALGYYSKTIFVFGHAWWREAGLSGVMDSTKGPISFSRDTCSEADGQYSITCFLTGDHGRVWSKWSAAERRRQVANQFGMVFGNAARKQGIRVPEPINVIEKEWTKDPWAWGAPSAVTMPGTLTADSGKTLRDPFGKVHFVGTETATVWKGYMEGAVRSGLRGANEIIDSLKET